VRNEANDILEWVAFHRLVGIEHFYIYDNNSTDDTAELLRSHFSEDVVTLIDWPAQPGQLASYGHAIANFAGATEWCAFIDADEFLFATAVDSLVAILESTDRASALCAFWLIFGSSGHRRRPGGLCIESFTHRAGAGFGPNGHPKSIVRLHEARGVKDPHLFFTRRGSIDERGRPLPRHRKGPTPQQEFSHERIRVNHYFTKSAEQWAIKQARGLATHKRSDPRFRRPDGDFHFHDRNEVEDLTIQRFLPRLRASLAALG
jgi:glycosyltransferase involved in cell wall biosynthesis